MCIIPCDYNCWQTVWHEFSGDQGGLAQFETAGMRLNILSTDNGITVIDDAYNAGDSMKRLLVLNDMNAKEE